MFDYYDLFIEKGAAKIEDLSETKWDSNFIKNFNDKSLKRSIFLQNDCEDVTSIYINYPALLLRKKIRNVPKWTDIAQIQKCTKKASYNRRQK